MSQNVMAKQPQLINNKRKSLFYEFIFCQLVSRYESTLFKKTQDITAYDIEFLVSRVNKMCNTIQYGAPGSSFVSHVF